MGERGQVQPTSEDLRQILDVARNKARAMGANTHESDDVAQLTALKLFLKWRSDPVVKARRFDDARWEAYIRSVARNVYKDEIKRHLRMRSRQTRAAGRDVPIMNQTGQISAPRSSNGVEAYLARALLAEEIMNLPQRQRAVAVRLCIEEKSIAEVAEELGLKEQSVRKHMRIAREMLRDRLSDIGKKQSL
ncbi:MAG: sigma-70 family RNA polymerase sigma factor [Actinomycetota bacterium]